MFLRRSSNIEGRNVDKLTSYADMALTDQHAGMMDRLGQSLLVDLGLETTFQQLLGCQLKDGIQLELIISEQSVPAHAAKQSSTLKDSGGILGVQRQQRTGRLSQLGKRILNTPDFTLTAKTILSNKLKFGIQTFLFVGSSRSLERLAICNKEEKSNV